MSEKVLIAYESRHGQTAKIARRIADALDARGVEASVVDLDDAPDDLEPSAYDAVAVGAPVYFGRHRKAATAFAREHAEALNATPSAFFSVSGRAADETEEAEAEARGYVDAFLDTTGWRPDRVARFGGAVAYTRYNVLLRFVMKRIARAAGRSTDASRDHEYTDWGAVEDFGRALAGMARRGRGSGVAAR